MAQLWQSDGVISGSGNGSQLNATIAGSTVTVNPGAVFIHGYYAELQNAQNLTVGTNGTIVAQVQFSTEVVDLYYKDGAVDYGPSATLNFEQSANNWEIPLWLVSSGTLIDLRTMITAASGSGWWGTTTGPVTVASSTTVQTNFLTLRVPYAGQALLRGELLLTFTDSSQAQSAICQLTYQFGLAEQQVTSTTTPSIPGGDPAGVPTSMPVALSGMIPVTQGRKGTPTGGVGWRVTAGTGPGLTLATLTATVSMSNLPAIA